MTGPGDGGRNRRGLPMLLCLLGLVLGAARLASAQEAATLPPALPPSPAPAAASSRTAREAELEGRLRQMEDLLKRMPDPEEVRRLQERLRTLPDPEHVRRLESTVERLSTQVDQLSTRLRQAEASARRPTSLNGTRAGPGIGGGGMPSPADDGGLGDGDGTSDLASPGGSGAPRAASTPPLSNRFDMPAPNPDTPTRTRFGPGFQIRTTDEEFDIQFHDLTQLDGRFYGIPNQTPVSDTFTVPRQWFIFSGHLTRPYQYYLSLSQEFDTFNILDLFLDVNFDPRLQFRFGRFKTPFTYEFWGEPTQGLANGERSLFFNNFAIDRELGAMLWGESVAGRVDYAAGIFNSAPNGQLDLSNPKSAIAFLNVAPFRPEAGSPLENLNIGGSVVAGNQDYAPIPQELRTIVPTSGSSVIGVPFLAFNNNVVAAGPRNLWDLHMAYYYGGLSLIGEWQSGFQDYALTNATNSRVRLPIESFYVQAAYVLTGERVASRGMVRPRRPFDLRPGRFGLGAWEVAARYSYLGLGGQVFTAGLADPNDWTDRLFTTDIGINWYWNQYLRVMFDWQHAGFGTPVTYAPGGFARTSDLFVLRFQIWF